jgi:predicted phosphodiesterase
MARRRIAILADTHVGLEGLQPSGREYGDCSAVLSSAVADLLRDEEPPDQAFFVGDIVNRGFDEEYHRARHILAPLQHAFEPILGNHELQRASVADFERHWSRRAVRSTVFSDFPAIVLNSGIENLPDDQWHGVLDDIQLRMLEEALIVHRDVPLFMFCHHPIEGTVRGSADPMGGLANSQELRRLIERRSKPVVLISGHTHRADLIRDGHITYVGCPPLGFWPHAYLSGVVEPLGDHAEGDVRGRFDRKFARPSRGRARSSRYFRSGRYNSAELNAGRQPDHPPAGCARPRRARARLPRRHEAHARVCARRPAQA